MLSFNFDGHQIDLELKFRALDRFLGLGRIWLNGRLLRGRRLMIPQIRTPFGFEVRKFLLRGHRCDADGIRLELECHGAAEGSMEWMLHSVRNREVTGDWSEGSRLEKCGKLLFELKPVTRMVDGEMAAGFTYQWHFSSAKHRIYKLTDRATWEPGGSIVGRSFWMRNPFAQCLAVLRRDSSYSTEWYLPSSSNPDIFQFLPFQTHLQGFTYTVGGGETLVTWATEVRHIRSLFEKEKGSNCLSHWHQHCGDLSNEFSTAPMEVLLFPGKRDRLQQIRLYDSVRALVSTSLHTQIGMREERVVPYAIVEEWQNADLERYRTEILPGMLEAGCRRVGLANHFQNNMNTYGVSNMCCNVDFQVAESVGEKKLADFVQAARKEGCSVEMWGNTAISNLVLLLAKTNGERKIDYPLPQGPDSILEAVRAARTPWLHNPTGGAEADHYHATFAVLNLRDPVIRDYWMRSWKKLKERTNIDGIFLDSSFNLSGDHFHYQRNTQTGSGGATMDVTELLGYSRPHSEQEGIIESQYLAHLSLMVEMQKAGFTYTGEDSGVFGIHRNGPSCVVRAEHMFMWNEFLATFDPRALLAAGHDPDQIFFEGLVWRNVWMFYWDFHNRSISFTPDGGKDPLCRPTPWHLRLLAAFDRSNRPGSTREVLRDGSGVIYRWEDESIFWSLREHELEFGGDRQVRALIADGEEIKTRSFNAKAREVYLIHMAEVNQSGAVVKQPDSITV